MRGSFEQQAEVTGHEDSAQYFRGKLSEDYHDDKPDNGQKSGEAQLGLSD
jgi:hypothetical protein